MEEKCYFSKIRYNKFNFLKRMEYQYNLPFFFFLILRVTEEGESPEVREWETTKVLLEPKTWRRESNSCQRWFSGLCWLVSPNSNLDILMKLSPRLLAFTSHLCLNFTLLRLNLSLVYSSIPQQPKATNKFYICNHTKKINK